MSIEELKGEIDRAFRVLGADHGLQQNAMDIIGWRQDGIINENEYYELRRYNRHQYSLLPLEW